MSYEERNSPKVVEGYIPVTGGNVWYKIVGANRKGIQLLVLHGVPGAPHDFFHKILLNLRKFGIFSVRDKRIKNSSQILQ